MIKKITKLSFIIPIALGLTSCINLDPNKKTVALLFPDKNAVRYISDCNVIKGALEAYGYNTIAQFANGDIEVQIAQIENMISLDVDCIMCMAIDSLALVGVEKSAKRAGIPVIAYDRLLMYTDALNYYYTFDNYQVGVCQGQSIIDAANLEEVRNNHQTKTIEFLGGSTDDNNAVFFYKGMMSKIKPYLDDGTLICRTGRTSFAEIAVDGWSQNNAQNNCDNYLSGFYPNKDLDILYCAADSLSRGAAASIESFGFSKENWPIVTGQDAELINIKNIIAGKQTSTIYKEGRLLGKKTAEGIHNMLSGLPVETNDTTSYDNGVLVAKTYLCDVDLITKDNYYEKLVATGYYTEEDLGLK